MQMNGSDPLRYLMEAESQHFWVAGGVLVLGMASAWAMARMCDDKLSGLFPNSSSAGRALIGRMLRLAVVTLSFLLALQILGIPLTSLLATGTVVFVGFGLALQKILQSLVAGTLLLLEREVEPGDVIRFEGEEYLVHDIGLRTAQLENRFCETLILPNYLLATSPVLNLTHRARSVEARLTVQVAYGSDPDVVEQALLRAADDIQGRTDGPAQALLRSFDDSGVTWMIKAPVTDPWPLPLRQSELGRNVAREFAAAGIDIPFPQLDLHVKDGLSSGRGLPP